MNRQYILQEIASIKTEFERGRENKDYLIEKLDNIKNHILNEY